MLARTEIAADISSVDSRIQCPRVQRQHPAVAVADHADFAFRGCEPIDDGEHFLDFVADEVPAQFEGRAVQEFAVRQAVEIIFAVDQDGHDDAAAGFGEQAGVLRFGRDSGKQAGDLFGRLIAVWNRDHIRDGFAAGWDEQQAFAVN